VAVSLNNGEGSFGPFEYFAEWDYFDHVSVGDFNDDRALDVIATNGYSSSVLLLTGNGDGTLVEEGMYGVASGAEEAVSFDADDDGLEDVVAISRYPGGASVLINTSDETPVEGAFYADAADDGTILLRWVVAELTGAAGLNVYRGLSPEGTFEVLNSTPLPVAGSGSLTDVAVWPGTTFWYRLTVVFHDGSEDVVGLAYATTEGVLELRLACARPNPMTGATTLEFSVPADSGRVRLGIYDAAGRLVTWVLDEAAQGGARSVEWDGTDGAGRRVSSGVYFARLEAGGDSEVRKIVLLR
jgi:hypothetical protein